MHAAPQRFRRRPLEIDAIRYNGANVDEIIRWVGAIAQIWRVGLDLWIDTPGRVLAARPGDWVICDYDGTLYCCAADIFEQAHEPVPATEHTTRAEVDGHANRREFGTDFATGPLARRAVQRASDRHCDGRAAQRVVAESGCASAR
ncbi:hypothetical protein [Nocardia sp. CNY236]|uniref:hypothetical protein n=1 Tax=Nocardia sp. CNY236 TaxID=1169152 RepID=UPI00040A0864|nr:hypothetical protein [Nocardia sp. CNY236]